MSSPTVNSPAVSVPAQPTSNVPSAIPPWLSPLLQTFTLAAVLGGVFAAGLWKGQIDTKLDDIVRVREEQQQQLKELTSQIQELNKSISYLEGTLQGTKAENRKPQH